MKLFTETVRIKLWHGYVLLGLTGYAVGSILAKVSAALGV